MVLHGKLHVLLVDPDETVLNATTLILERLGYAVHAEIRNLNALRTFSENPDRFDLAIIDPIMPELTGLELAVRLGRIRRGFPVLLYTAYLDPLLEEDIKTAGLGRAIVKPLGMKELGAEIREGLSGAFAHTH